MDQRQRCRLSPPRSVNKSATNPGANTPRSNTAPAITVSAGLAAALPRKIAKDVAQQIHVAA